MEAGLPQKVIDVLSEKGITHFTPVQGEAFDPVLAGKDVIGRSRTGTGKTLAFGLPSLTRLTSYLQEKGYRDENGRMMRGRPVSMLVLCPTRELARQVQEELTAVARPLRLFVDVFHGGVSYDPQVSMFRPVQDQTEITEGTNKLPYANELSSRFPTGIPKFLLLDLGVDDPAFLWVVTATENWNIERKQGSGASKWTGRPGWYTWSDH